MFSDAPALVLVSFPFLLAAAAISDMRRYIIPNWVSLWLVAAFVPAIGFSGLGWAAVGEHVAVGLAAFALGFLLFAVRAFGGGDGKLLAAAALWFSWETALWFLIYTMLIGGALGVAIIFAYNLRFQLMALPLLGRLDYEKLRQKAPYGVAIAAGALLAFPDSDIYRAYFPPALFG